MKQLLTRIRASQPAFYVPRLIFFLLLSFLSLSVVAQHTVTGKVLNSAKQALIGATVAEKGTTTATTTGADGSFRLTVSSSKATLEVSYVGFETMEIAIADRTTVDFELKESTSSLTDVVVVGYATQKKVTVTGAVSAIKGETLIKSPAVDITNSLAGRLPGLVVIQQSGEPGYDGATISIRGLNTLGNNSPTDRYRRYS